MNERDLGALLDWLYIFGFFIGIGVIAIIIILVISLIVYLKTGVHVKDWIDEKTS